MLALCHIVGEKLIPFKFVYFSLSIFIFILTSVYLCSIGMCIEVWIDLYTYEYLRESWYYRSFEKRLC